MISSKYFSIIAVLVVLGLASKSAQATEGVPGDQSLTEQQGTPSDAAGGSEAEPQSPKSPIRVSTIDFEDTGGGSGKLTMAGIALPGNELYLFLDDEPFAKVLPDEGGKWTIENEMKLDEGRHTFRADQYDPASNMLAARAMVSIERRKQGSGEAAEPPPPKATTP